MTLMNRWACMAALACAAGCAALSARAADTLTWQTNGDLVSADIKDTTLFPILEQVARTTGWRIYVEPNIDRKVSAKFKDLPPGDALHRLLEGLNFALDPETNGVSKLYVFRTRVQSATLAIHADKAAAAVAEKPKPIPNQLIVRLKPGVKIDDLARQLGARVVGHIDGINAYLLQFDGADATASAQTQLASNSQVSSVESNYPIDRPEVAQAVPTGAPPLQLQLNPPPANGRVIIGLVDTGLQEPLPNGLDSFLLKQQSVAGNDQFDPGSPSHGTSMAETMLRTLQTLGGGSTSVQILPVDVYGPNPTTTTFDVAQGFALAVNGGAQIINLSLGSSTDSQTLQDLILEANQKGISVYAAKGNTPVTTPSYPAADQGVTPVTALQPNGQVTSWANEAPFPAVGAIGTVIVPFDNESFAVEGTSPATAIVSATAASLMEKGSLSAAEANAQILKGPTPTTIPGK